MIDYINRSRQQHIITIEDPIEILHSDHGCIVNQREIGLDTMDFMEALRRALAEDPEMRADQSGLPAASSGRPGA